MYRSLTIDFNKTSQLQWYFAILAVKVFLSIRKGQRRPVLLVMDNQKSHDTIKIVEETRRNQIILLGFPETRCMPCSHNMSKLVLTSLEYILRVNEKLPLYNSSVNTFLVYVRKLPLATQYYNQNTVKIRLPCVSFVYRQSSMRCTCKLGILSSQVLHTIQSMNLKVISSV